MRIWPVKEIDMINITFSDQKFFRTFSNYMGGSRGGGGQGVQPPPPPLENSQKYRVSLQYWSEFPEKSQSYQASIQCWAIIGPRQDGPFIAIFGSSIPSSTKKINKKTLSNLDLLWQNFLDPRMNLYNERISRSRECISLHVTMFQWICYNDW